MGQHLKDTSLNGRAWYRLLGILTVFPDFAGSRLSGRLFLGRSMFLALGWRFL